jgi:hypothetical protein
MKDQTVWFDGLPLYFNLEEVALLAKKGYEVRYKEDIEVDVFAKAIQYMVNELAVAAIVSGDTAILSEFPRLGKIQVVEHDYSGSDYEFEQSYQNKDWSIDWRINGSPKTLSRFSPQHKAAILRRIDRKEVSYRDFFLDEEEVIKRLSLLSKINHV